MEDATDISFYLGKQAVESIGNLDIPLSNGQIVSINLVNELPDDPNELISFLETENCPKKYWIAVGQAYAQSNKLDDAVKLITKALSLKQFNEKDKVSLNSFLSWVYLKYASKGINKQENLTNASDLINKINSMDNANVSNILARGTLYLYRDEADYALQTFDRLLKIDSNNCFAILSKANLILNKSKNYTNALKLYQQVLLLNPVMTPDPRIGIGLCFWLLKDEKMALNSWERALEINPNNTKAKILLNLSKFNTLFNNSLTDEEFIKNYKLCLTDLSEIYKDNQNDPVILLTLASYYFSKGSYELVEKIVTHVIKTISGGNTNSVKSHGNKLSSFQANILSHASFWLGRISFVKNDFAQSQRYFHESIKLNEQNLLSKLGLGQSQIGRGSTEEAILTFESILKTNSKCLEVNYALGCLYSQQKSKRKQEQAIQFLERYLRLSSNRGLNSEGDDTTLLNKEPVALNAFLILSQLYETRDMGQALTYLNKAIEERKRIGQDAPLEVYNNIGVFNFIKNNYEDSIESFKTALGKLDDPEGFKSEDGDLLIDLPNDLKVSIKFNLARSTEFSDSSDDAIDIYESLLKECPHYFSAKLRLLFLDCISNKSAKEDIKSEIDELLSLNASDLEIRSFYGWFVRNFGKKLNLNPDSDTTHHRDTLVKYDSHDCYALISLANIYCTMARDIKGSSNDEKKKRYYIRAIELFTKVLSVDPKNVYAAQGLAIVYIENKEQNKGLDILRKIRDSLNDISIYLNLGHVLVDLKQYSKAIENYGIALARYSNPNDSKILSFLARAWYLRGLSEKSFPYLKKSLEYCQEALDSSQVSKSSLKFNLAYVQFQTAEFISKFPVEQRNVDDINETILNLNEAVKTFTELSSDAEKHSPYPKQELKARASLGGTTLLNRLNVCLEEVKENINKVEEKLELAKKLREEEEASKVKEAEEAKAALQAKEAELAKERAKLQEQAQQWAEEARMNVVVDDEDDDKLFNEETAEKESKKKKGGRKAGSTNKGAKGKKKGRKNKAVVEDSEEESPEPSDNESEEQASPRKRKSAVSGDEDEDDDNISAKNTNKKKKFKSSDIIEDSDDELDDDLFGGEDNNEESKPNDED